MSRFQSTRQLVQSLSLGSIVLTTSRDEARHLFRDVEEYHGPLFARSIDFRVYERTMLPALRGHVFPIVATAPLWDSLRTPDFLALQQFLERHGAKRKAVRS